MNSPILSQAAPNSANSGANSNVIDLDAYRARRQRRLAAQAALDPIKRFRDACDELVAMLLPREAS